MGVKPVDFGDGKGPVPIDNHDKALKALQNRQDLDLDTAQIKWAEKFLSEDEKDEIFYSENESKARGQEAINTDADGDGEKDTDKGSGAGSGVGLGSSIVSCVAAITAAVASCGINGFIALIGAGIAMAAAISAGICATPTIFDTGYSERETFSGEAEGNIETMNTTNDDLVDSMDQMTEDAETYQEQSNLFTLTVNNRVNEKAELQGRLAKLDPGDTDGKAEIEGRLLELEKENDDDMTANMDETRENIEMYSSKNSEAIGMVETGTEVSTFLQEGNSLSGRANASGILLTIGAGALGLAVALSAIPKMPFAVDAFAGISGSVIFGAAAAIMGYAASRMYSTSGKEEEFGKNGDSMSAAVSDLGSMAEQQQGFIESTNEGYDATDEQAAQTQADASEAANKAKQVMEGKPMLKPDADGGIYNNNIFANAGSSGSSSSSSEPTS